MSTRAWSSLQLYVDLDEQFLPSRFSLNASLINSMQFSAINFENTKIIKIDLTFSSGYIWSIAFDQLGDSAEDRMVWAKN